MTRPSMTVDDLVGLGVLNPAEVQVATTIGRIAGDDDPLVLATIGLAVRAVRYGHVCLELARVVAQGLVDDDGRRVDVAMPAVDDWRDILIASPLVRSRLAPDDTPLVIDDDRLYLDRYWRLEQRLAQGLAAASQPANDRDLDELERIARSLVGDEPQMASQRQAVVVAARQRLTVLTGGPGTGKTTTLVRILAALVATAVSPQPFRVVLAAPTGKAAARMAEAVREGLGDLDLAPDVAATLGAVEALTLHRLLGANPSQPTRFRYHGGRRLPYDMVVVDEASMVSLPLMARLVDAVGPATRLVLVGDHEQLASVDAGAVLADIAAGDVLGDAHVHLTEVFRFRHKSGIDEVARSLQRGDVDQAMAMLDGRHDDAVLIDPPGVDRQPGDTAGADGAPADVPVALWERMVGHADHVRALAASRAPAQEVLREVDRFKVLVPLRRGPLGVRALNEAISRSLQRQGESNGAAPPPDRLPVGTPVIITRNDHPLGLFNGDVGVVIPGDDAASRAIAFWRPDGQIRRLSPSRLPPHEPVHVMSVHRSQGSQFDEVILLMPSIDSPLLTRELVYTALTRARQSVTVVADQQMLSAALRRRVQRSSGLRESLRQASRA